MAGRPTKLTPETHKLIVDSIAAGAYGERAAEYAGIDPATYYRWMQRGEHAQDALDHPPLKPDYPSADEYRAARRAWGAKARAEAPFRLFREAVMHAGARAEMLAVATLTSTLQSATRAVVVQVKGGGQRVEYHPDHGERTKAAIELLRRRWPERWTDRQRIETEAHVVVEASDALTPAQQAAIDQALMQEDV